MTAPLRFATFLAPNMLPLYRFLADRIGERLGRRVELVVGRSWAYNDPASHSGHAVTLYSLVRMGARPGFFAAVVQAGFHSFGPSTIQPVVAASRLPERLKAEVRKLLVSLGDDPSARPRLAHGFIERFAAVGDGAYDDIRAMLATIQAAGWTSLIQR